MKILKIKDLEIPNCVEAERAIITLVSNKGEVSYNVLESDNFEIEEEPKTVTFEDLKVGDYFKLRGEYDSLKMKCDNDCYYSFAFKGLRSVRNLRGFEIIPVKAKLEVLEDEA